MAKLLDLIRAASTRIFDPEKESRVEALALEVERRMRRQRSAFNFSKTVAALNVHPRDVGDVAERTFERALRRAWRDRVITQKERTALDWIARALDLDPSQVTATEERVGRGVFEGYLARAMADGRINKEEAGKLRDIAASIGSTTRKLVLDYFAHEGEGFLRGVFASIAGRGRITEAEWRHLLSATQALGLTEADLLRIIRPQAERFVEHVLADAKADERLSASEQETLQWLLNRLKLTPRFRTYVETEIEELKKHTDIAEGRLPSIPHTGVTLRAGEIVHFQGHAQYVRIRHLKSGARVDTHNGTATITDVRMIFSSDTKSFDVNHRKVLDMIPLSCGMQLRTSGRGGGNFDFGSNNKLAVAIYRVAVGKANQMIVEKTRGVPSRHIPRDVRQRVWQKYAGRCAVCNASQYLEFDHIIPVAKGGGNTEANVQLLCRKCNLKKSDRI